MAKKISEKMIYVYGLGWRGYGTIVDGKTVSMDDGTLYDIVDDSSDFGEYIFYDDGYTIDAIRRFIEHGVKTNIHYVVGRDSIDEAIERLENNDFPEGVNAVLFLLYKPAGKVKDNNTLHPRDPRVKRFYELIETEHPFKCGLDSCHMPGVVNFTTKVLPESMSPCDAARFSMYITPDGFALPCSFDTTTRNWAVDLKTQTISDVWNGEVFEQFREHNKRSCSSCKLVSNCLGGCGLMATKINICDNDERDYVRMGT